MEILAKYIHGSEDSLDLDVFYVVDALPSDDECYAFCTSDPTENRNLITIADGIVTGCYIGTPDEVNNSLIDTYSLHSQTSPLLVTRRVQRDIPLKSLRAIRGILSQLSRTQYRAEIKSALKGTWSERINVLRAIDFTTIDFDSLRKKMDGTDTKKFIAFQIGQALGLLIANDELYTKKQVADHFPLLREFLYRNPNADIADLEQMKNIFVSFLRHLNVVEDSADVVYFPDFGHGYRYKDETLVE